MSNVPYTEIGVERWHKAQPEVAELCVRHWAEIAKNRDIIELAPDWDKYSKMSDAGLLHLTTARQYGLLVGYMLYIVMPHLHYSKSLTAFADVLYLMPECRQGTTGIRLLKVAEESLRGMCVQRVMQNVKPSNDWSLILTRMGYTEFETIYQKILG